MSKPTLGRARGLNSIADPSDFKGSRGRPTADDSRQVGSDSDRRDQRDDGRAADSRSRTVDTGDRDPDDRRGGVAIAGNNGEDSSGGDRNDREAAFDSASATTPLPRGGKAARSGSGRAEKSPGHRTRRELSVPIPVSEAVEETGINPADVVMSAYRRHGDAIYTGSGGRLVSKGRRRLRLSLTDGDYDKITRLGDARGWNRSETVAVLLAMELLDDDAYAMP